MSDKPIGSEITDWSNTELGKLICDLEKDIVRDVVNSVPGVRILQIGTFRNNDFITVNRQVNYYLIDPFDQRDKKVALVATPCDLPYQNESLDIVILLHTLEFSHNPQRVLYEAERVLSPDGYLIVMGFNPLSFMGIKRIMSFNFGKSPWRGHYFTISRLKDWFAVLGLDLTLEKKFFYRPPLQNKLLLSKLSFLESFLARWVPWFCGEYLIMARKRIIPLSLLRSRWMKRKGILNGGVIQPAPKTNYLKSKSPK